MTHEPQHTRMGTIKRNSRTPDQPEPTLGPRSDESTSASSVGEPGPGDAGDHGNVVGGSDGQGGSRSDQTADADTVYPFGVDGDFGCTRPPGIDGVWSTVETFGVGDAGEDLADRAGGCSGGDPGRSRQPDSGEAQADGEAQAGREASRSTAEIFWEGGSECGPEATDLLDSGDVSPTGRGIEPAA